MTTIDSVLLVSFGGPEQPDDVMPFLRNVTAGRDVPEDRLQVVARQYLQFGGRSPINDQNRRLVRSLEAEFVLHGIDLPIYWGNRNWNPFVRDAVGQMVDDGKKHAVAIVTSAYSSYSSCRQYREDIADAVDEINSDEHPIRIDKVGQFYDESGFVDPFVDGLDDAFAKLRTSFEADRLAVIFTAHSIPHSMAQSSRYEDQLRRTAQRVIEQSGVDSRWDLAFQSRSGSPRIPWLEPDINDHLRSLHGSGTGAVVVVPIGFLSDHQEVIFDLDFTAKNTADALGLQMIRVETPGTDARFVRMLRQKVESHLQGNDTIRCLGAACCPAPARHRASES